MMKSDLKFSKSSKNKYIQLLFALISNFVFSPFSRGDAGGIITSFMFLYSIVIIVKTFSLRPKLFKFYIAIAFSAFILEICGRIGLYNDWQLAFLLLIQFVYVLYLAGAIYLILRDIISSKLVTIDTICGSICVYLLIGFVWALFYSMIGTLDSNAFSQKIIDTNSWSKAVYFSFSTLTTLGYGDIVPINSLAKMLTNSQAMIGQLYPAILISILVGIYTFQKNK